MSFIKKVFGLEEEFEEEYYEEEATPEKKQEAEPVPTRANRAQKPNVVSIQSAPSKQSGAKVLLIEPRAYSEVQQIADHLLNKKAVVINLQQVEYDQAKRIVDFLSGTTYAVGGDIRRIGSSTFLCTSDNVDVSGQISDLHIDYNNDTRGW